MIALLLAGSAVGCGSSKDVPEARFTFSDAGLRPAIAQVDAAPEIRLQIAARDGRPHGVVVMTPAGRVRIVVAPDATATATLADLHADTDYRIVPDGATEPVTLRVR